MWKKSLFVLVLAAAMLAAGCSGGENNPEETNVNENSAPNNSENNAASNTGDEQGENSGDTDTNDTPAPIDGKVMESADGSIQLTFPEEWLEDSSLNRAALIGASKYDAEKYTIVIPTQKATLSDDATLEDYYNTMAASMEQTIVNYEETETEEITINGLSALQYEVNGEVDSVKITYLITLVESENRFYQLASWTLPSKYADYENEYKAIAQSFTVSAEAEAAAAEQGSSEEVSKTFESADGNIKIDVPEGWEPDHTVSNPAADFILSSEDLMKYMMVIRDAKSDLAEGMTLAEYQELLEEMTQTTGIEEYESTEPEELEIDGNSALQYEVVGSIQGVKLHYLYTVVETNDYFHQIMLWSDQATFPSQKELFKEISSSYKFSGE